MQGAGVSDSDRVLRSEARRLVTLHGLYQRGGKRRRASLCAGGGEANSLAVEMMVSSEQ
jgi:hypothetical protein